MRIELQWAMVEGGIPDECALCEAQFEGTPVIIRIDPFGYEICEQCLRALNARKEQVPDAPWPSFAEYQEAVRTHPEPMFASEEEMEAAEEPVEGPPEEAYDPLWRSYAASWLWRAEATH